MPSSRTAPKATPTSSSLVNSSRHISFFWCTSWHSARYDSWRASQRHIAWWQAIPRRIERSGAGEKARERQALVLESQGDARQNVGTLSDGRQGHAVVVGEGWEDSEGAAASANGAKG